MKNQTESMARAIAVLEAYEVEDGTGQGAVFIGTDSGAHLELFVVHEIRVCTVILRTGSSGPLVEVRYWLEGVYDQSFVTDIASTCREAASIAKKVVRAASVE